MSRREAVHGVSVEGLAVEFRQWHTEHRPDLPWPVAFVAWVETLGGLPADVARAVRVEVVRRRVFGVKP